MRLVAVESPYAPQAWVDGVRSAVLAANLAYARRCMADCLRRGESPYASHLLLTQPGVLDDDKPEERRLGIEAGLAWAERAELRLLYVDRGVSGGMREGIAHALRIGQTILVRSLGACPASRPDGEACGHHLGLLWDHAACPEAAVHLAARRDLTELYGGRCTLGEIHRWAIDGGAHLGVEAQDDVGRIAEGFAREAEFLRALIAERERQALPEVPRGGASCALHRYADADAVARARGTKGSSPCPWCLISRLHAEIRDLKGEGS